VALSSDGLVLFVGGSNPLTIYAWDTSTNDWEEQKTFTTAGTIGHIEVSADGNNFVANDEVFKNNKGSVFVYSYDGGIWTKVGNTLEGTNTKIGKGVDINADGAVIAIGAYEEGCASVYDYNSVTLLWEERFKIDKSGNGNVFGGSLSLSSDATRLIVSANIFGGADETGAAFIYSVDSSSFTQLYQVSGTKDDRLGIFVTMSADGMVSAIGCSKIGYVKVVMANDTTKTIYTERYNIEDGVGLGGTYGKVLALSGDGSRLIVGAPNTAKGNIYIYSIGISAEDPEELIVSQEGDENGSKSGRSVAMSSDGNRVVMGMPAASSGNGATKVFEYSAQY